MFKMTDNFFTKYIFFFNFNHANNHNIILFKLFNFFYVLKNFDYDFDKSKNVVDYYFIIKFNKKLYPLNNKSLYQIFHDDAEKILL